MDDADISTARQELAMELFEKQRRERQKTITKFYRYCLYCNDDTKDGAPYCCRECQVDDERIKKAKIRNGK